VTDADQLYHCHIALFKFTDADDYALCIYRIVRKLTFVMLADFTVKNDV